MRSTTTGAGRGLLAQPNANSAAAAKRSIRETRTLTL